MNWTPEHPAVADAWAAVKANLETRDRGSWSVAVSIASKAGLGHRRASDFIWSCVKHGWLEGDERQVRLP